MSARTLIRHAAMMITAACLFAGPATATAQIRFGVGIGLPSVSIGINVPAYPQLMPIPGYPVYYAPALDTNLFFYDGLYWVFANGQWYSSSWYDGPWYLVEPEMVPDFILRIPILYYRRPPLFFHRWNRYAAPHWGEHWGRAWERRRGGWNRWDRRAVPPRAPLPRYQRAYPRDRYPDRARQRALENRYYRFRPQENRSRGLERYPGRTGPRSNQRPAQRPPGNRAPSNRFAPSRGRTAPPQRESRPRRMPPRTRSAAPQRESRQRGGPPPRSEQRPERPRRGEPPR